MIQGTPSWRNIQMAHFMVDTSISTRRHRRLHGISCGQCAKKAWSEIRRFFSKMRNPWENKLQTQVVWCVYINIYIYMYICIYVYMYISISIYLYIYISIYIYICMYICIYIYIYIYIYISIYLYIYICMYMYVYMYIYISISISISIYLFMYIYVCMYVYMYIHISSYFYIYDMDTSQTRMLQEVRPVGRPDSTDETFGVGLGSLPCVYADWSRAPWKTWTSFWVNCDNFGHLSG